MTERIRIVTAPDPHGKLSAMLNWQSTLDPIAELDGILRARDGERGHYIPADGTLPLRWLVEHASSGDITGIWNASKDLYAMVRLAGRLAPLELVVRTACACARVVLSHTAVSDPRVLRALEVAEAWTPEQSDDSALRVAAEEINIVARDIWSDDPAGDAVDAAWHAVSAATKTRRYCVDGAAYSVSHALETAQRASDSPKPPNQPLDLDAVTNELGATVRRMLPCPDLTTLMEQRNAFRSRQ